MRESELAGERALAKLVRFIAGGVRLPRAGTGDTVLLSGATGEARTFDRSLLEAACARGLVRRRGEGVEATREASAFLRRAALSAEDRFPDQHRSVERRDAEVEGGRQSVRVNLAESPLAGLARLKEKSGEPFLTPAALEAGLRLHAEFTRAQLQPRLTMAYEPRLAGKTRGGAAGTAELCDNAAAARSRVAKAVTVMGPELSGVALDICCFEKGLETVERERQWPVRSAKLMLRAALMALARHYAPPAPRTRDRAWGDEGFRPQASDVATNGPAGRP